VQPLSSGCPHACCSVDYYAKLAAFVCPCHDSTIAL
jgi:Rieske Fe-S protein